MELLQFSPLIEDNEYKHNQINLGNFRRSSYLNLIIKKEKKYIFSDLENLCKTFPAAARNN